MIARDEETHRCESQLACSVLELTGGPEHWSSVAISVLVPIGDGSQQHAIGHYFMHH